MVGVTVCTVTTLTLYFHPQTERWIRRITNFTGATSEEPPFVSVGRKETRKSIVGRVSTRGGSWSKRQEDGRVVRLDSGYFSRLEVKTEGCRRYR